MNGGNTARVNLPPEVWTFARANGLTTMAQDNPALVLFIYNQRNKK